MAEEADKNKKPTEGEDTDPKKQNGEDNGDKTFDQSQVDEIVSKRLGEEKAKMEKTIAEKIAEAQADAERKAKLSEDERKKEESKQQQEKITARETELALRESGIEAKELLQSKGISTDLVDFVVDADLDTTKSNVDKLEKAFTKAVESGVAEKLKGKTPDDPSNKGGDGKPAPTGQIAF